MEFDLHAKKLQKEAERRLQEAKRKRLHEAKLQLEQKQREEILAAKALEAKLKLEEELRIKEELAAELKRKAGGILFSKTDLVPYLIEGEDDRIIVPESILTQLSEQDVFSKGAVYFEISSSASNDIISHCGVREFSSEEGTIGLTPKVMNSLLRSHTKSINDLGTISITYIRLPKIQKVKFSVQTEAFFNLTYIKHVLEENLKLHTTLSTNDILTVWYRGKSYDIIVKEIQPEPYGTLIDTDIEVEFVEDNNINATSIEQSLLTNKESKSMNTLSYIDSQSKLFQSSSSSSSLVSSNNISTDMKSSGNKLSNTSTTTMNMNNNSSSSSSSSSFNISQLMEYPVPTEPSLTAPAPSSSSSKIVTPITEDDIINIRVRIPTGPPLTRKFYYRTDTILDLLHYVCNHMKMNKEYIQLMSPSNNQIYTGKNDQDLANMTFESIGLSKREMFVASILVS